MAAQGYCHFNEGGGNKSFTINLFGSDLVIQQDPGSTDLGHGAVVWDASVVLAKYMEKNAKDYDHSKLASKTVVELGSGCGLGGLAFMLKGSKVTFTDLENVTTRLTERNVQAIYMQAKTSMDVLVNEPDKGKVANQLFKPVILPIDWTHNPLSIEAKQKAIETEDKLAASTSINTNINISSFPALLENAPYDIVLLTDCVFSVELAQHLVNTILCCCGPRTTVLCCHEIRDEVY